MTGAGMAQSAGTTFCAMTSYVSQFRKSFVTLIVRASSRRSYSVPSESSTRE